MKQLFSIPLALLVAIGSSMPAYAQQAQQAQEATADESQEATPPPADIAGSAAVRDQPNVGSIAALGTIAFGSFAAGTAMLVASASTASELDEIPGNLLIDQERRNTLTLRKGSQQVLGATFIGIGALATTGFSVLLARHLDAKRDRAELVAVPLFIRGGGGVQLDVRF